MSSPKDPKNGKVLQLGLAVVALIALVMAGFRYYQFRNAVKGSKDAEDLRERIMWLWLPLASGSLALSVGLDWYNSTTMPMAVRQMI